MNRTLTRSIGALALMLTAGACNQAPALLVERLPDVRPDLPEVPQIPPPPAANADGSLPISRLRRMMEENLDHDVTVQGYIVEIYQPPECPRGQQCPRPLIPHFYIADEANEGDVGKRLLIIGYAQTWDELQTLIRMGTRVPALEDGSPRSPIDFAVGARVNVAGKFVTTSTLAAGFQSTAGLIDYARHTTLEPAPAPAAP